MVIVMNDDRPAAIAAVMVNMDNSLPWSETMVMMHYNRHGRISGRGRRIINGARAAASRRQRDSPRRQREKSLHWPVFFL